MIKVDFTQIKKGSKLSADECLNKYFDIVGILEEKFNELDKTKSDDATFTHKCKELQTYINDEETNYKECFEGKFAPFYRSIEDLMKNSISKYSHYSRCNSELSSKDNENVKGEHETEELCKGVGCKKEEISAEKVDKTESDCPDGYCDTEHPGLEALPNQEKEDSQRQESIQEATPPKISQEAFHQNNHGGTGVTAAEVEVHSSNSVSAQQVLPYVMVPSDNSADNGTHSLPSIPLQTGTNRNSDLVDPPEKREQEGLDNAGIKRTEQSDKMNVSPNGDSTENAEYTAFPEISRHKDSQTMDGSQDLHATIAPVASHSTTQGLHGKESSAEDEPSGGKKLPAQGDTKKGVHGAGSITKEVPVGDVSTGETCTADYFVSGKPETFVQHPPLKLDKFSEI